MDKDSHIEKAKKDMEKHREYEETVRKLPPSDIVRIVLSSDIVCYGPEPEDGEEVAQRVTISSNGLAYVVHRYWNRNASYSEYKSSKPEIISIGKEKATAAFLETHKLFADFIERAYTDVGSWSLGIYFSNGMVMNRSCSMGTAPEGYSKYIRSLLKKNNLFMCDGNWKN